MQRSVHRLALAAIIVTLAGAGSAVAGEIRVQCYSDGN